MLLQFIQRGIVRSNSRNRRLVSSDRNMLDRVSVDSLDFYSPGDT